MKYCRIRGALVTSLWLVCVAFLTSNLPAQQSNGVLREVYLGIGGGAVSDLTSNPSFPNSPSLETIQSIFEAPTEFAENYGQRMRALLLPPITGNYTFWIASDDGGALYLSSNDNPASKVQIATVNAWTSSREWTKEPNQQSATNIFLTAGQRYYIEALQKEGGGGDNLAVRWRLPNGTIEEPIPNNRLLIYGLGPPIISQQPANTSVVEFGTELQCASAANDWSDVSVVSKWRAGRWGHECDLPPRISGARGQWQFVLLCDYQFAGVHQLDLRHPHSPGGHRAPDLGCRRKCGRFAGGVCHVLGSGRSSFRHQHSELCAERWRDGSPCGAGSGFADHCTDHFPHGREFHLHIDGEQRSRSGDHAEYDSSEFTANLLNHRPTHRCWASFAAARGYWTVFTSTRRRDFGSDVSSDQPAGWAQS
ncbi:MAG: hypothetical protein IPK15_16840 [Verrucomicrobia bacterium]|nr:hypothetical protein [Verrucomicrobiota bacterium]